MQYRRMPIEVESPEETGYQTIRYNLAESSVRDLRFDELNIDLSGLTIFYGEHRGKKQLREIIASESDTLHPDDVLITSGAATALFLVATSLLSAQDHLVVVRPNYATNLETPRAIGCQMSIVELTYENNFALNPEAIEAQIKPNTRLISITNPGNPTGILYEQSIIDRLIQIAEKHGCYLLVDETYRDLNFQTPLIPYASVFSDKVLSVCSLSKAFGVPGIRIGWVICQDKTLMNKLLAAKEQVIIANSVIDEEIALHLLTEKYARLRDTHQKIRENFKIMSDWFEQQTLLTWVRPQAGVVCFPKLKDKTGFDSQSFLKNLYEKHQTVVGPGHWFEQESVYFRIGFGYPLPEELRQGLANIDECLKTM
jgi:aspartate/methionine/tyrosine aminotransferase